MTFSYPSRQEVNVLKELTFHVYSGDVVGIVGESGCGKSTITNLLHRFYDVKGGRVIIDGVDIRKLNLKSYHRQIGYVSQQPTLFSGNIEENIVYGLEEREVERYTQKDLDYVCKLANCYDFIHDKS